MPIAPGPRHEPAATGRSDRKAEPLEITTLSTDRPGHGLEPNEDVARHVKRGSSFFGDERHA